MFRKVAVLTMAAAVTIVAAAPPASATAEESGFVSKINGARSASGLDQLEVYWDLTDDARSHTNAMVDAGEIFHSSNLGSVTSDWWALGENVGVGADVAQLHEAFMASAPHRANILGDFNYVGVGTGYSEDGYLYVTVIFMKGPDDLLQPAETEVTPPTTTAAPAATTTTAPVATTTTTAPVSNSTARPRSQPTPSEAQPAPEPGGPRHDSMSRILLMADSGVWPSILPDGWGML